jgi:hypothetical protein
VRILAAKVTYATDTTEGNWGWLWFLAEAFSDALGKNRPRGRPRRTWNDNIQELFTKQKELKKLFEERTAWGAVFKTSTP